MNKIAIIGFLSVSMAVAQTTMIPGEVNPYEGATFSDPTQHYIQAKADQDKYGSDPYAAKQKAAKYQGGVEYSFDDAAVISKNEQLSACVSLFYESLKDAAFDSRIQDRMDSIHKSYQRLDPSYKSEGCTINANAKTSENKKNVNAEITIVCGSWMEYSKVSWRTDLEGGRCAASKDLVLAATKEVDEDFQSRKSLRLRK